jgi:hypothetical protein
MLTAVHYEEKHETRCIQPWPKLQYHSADTSDAVTFRIGVAYSIGNITTVIALARRITRINDPAFDGCHSVVKQKLRTHVPVYPTSPTERTVQSKVVQPILCLCSLNKLSNTFGEGGLTEKQRLYTHRMQRPGA